MHRMWGVVVGGLVAAVVLGGGGARAQQPNPIPETFTNLQVLSKDTPRAQLVAGMRFFTRSLGVRCEHCHVGEGNDLSKFDFASDAKPQKVTARKMMRLSRTINETLEAAPNTQKVNCFTCHRGTVAPLTVPPAGGGLAF